jgi:hypothetical protein
MRMSDYCYALVEFERWDPELRIRLASCGITPWRLQDAVAYSRFPTSMTIRVLADDEREAMTRLSIELPLTAQVVSPVAAMPAEPGEEDVVRTLVAGARRSAAA